MLGAATLLALAAGCTSSSDSDKPPSQQPPSTAASPPAWVEPPNYSFVVERRCEGKESLGTYRVTVTAGQVASSERTDGKTAAGEEEIEVPTLSGLLDLAHTAADDGGTMTTSADPADGHPTAVSFDVSDGQDNEDNTCFLISDYKLS
ncbi:DUF6174 domain-containing protein [Actinoplanes sp. N902-109]|uniref:DUF6174 domain-containing protein n=1 Tax=Actinoplanes sp. (strain N902-109) TaxID=649831 RepID=UPI0003294AAF|nr:DUF6174 domain-containing protein [Actinoplanes sp. N902-109]AGL15734.1 hypothetical protein L083_2224 [Actinoplanes sp. N902-109]